MERFNRKSKNDFKRYIEFLKVNSEKRLKRYRRITKINKLKK